MQSVLDRLSRQDAFSQDRESYLGKLANLFVTADVDVRFDSLPAPADCREAKDGEFIVRIDNTEFVQVCKEQSAIKSEAIPDSLRGVSNGYIDAFLQEGLLYHELGHVLFSDFDALNDVTNQVPMSERDVLQNLINVYEDAVIEIFLRQMYDCGEQLLIKNQIYHNLFHADSGLWQIPQQAEPLSQANLVAFELGRVETGALDQIDTRAKEAGIEAFYDVIQMPNAEERYDRLLDLFQELKDESDLGDSREEMEESQEGEADQSGRQDSQQVQAPAIDLSPDEDEEDEDEDSGGGSSSDEDGDEESEDSSSGSSGDEDEDEEDSEEDSQEDSDDSQSQDEGEDEELPSVGSVEDQLDEEDVDELVDETEVDPNESDDDIDQIESELKGAGAGEDEIKTPDPKDFCEDQNIIRRAEQRSRYLKRVVEDHFEPTKGNAVNRDRTHGNFDSTRMVSAARGSPRCFKTEDNPEKPDFQVVIAVDASGSMDGDGMSEAAEAATMATKAFEDAGGEVYAYRFGIYAELIKTPSMPYDESKSALSSLDTTGATSLLPVLRRYQDLSQGVDNSFLFVITDGMPSYDELCKEQLRDIDDPTACLQYDEYGDGFGDTYDAFQVIKNSDEIQEKSTSLIRRLVERGGASL